MKTARQFALVLVTAPNPRVARRLAKAALRANLIACANLVPGIESHYRWRGKVASGREVLIVMKTTRARLGELEQLILAEHPYDTPEFVVLPMTAGSANYLKWIADSTRGNGNAGSKSTLNNPVRR